LFRPRIHAEYWGIDPLSPLPREDAGAKLLGNIIVRLKVGVICVAKDVERSFRRMKVKNGNFDELFDTVFARGTKPKQLEFCFVTNAQKVMMESTASLFGLLA
jgi:hypothetical protein